MLANKRKLIEIIVVSNQAIDLNKFHSDKYSIEHRFINSGRKSFVADLIKNPQQEFQTSVDVIIRLNGSMSLSDSVVTEACYAELFFSAEDERSFDQSHLEKILEEFHSRKRNFGS